MNFSQYLTGECGCRDSGSSQDWMEGWGCLEEQGQDTHQAVSGGRESGGS